MLLIESVAMAQQPIAVIILLLFFCFEEEALKAVNQSRFKPAQEEVRTYPLDSLRWITSG